MELHGFENMTNNSSRSDNEDLSDSFEEHTENFSGSERSYKKFFSPKEGSRKAQNKGTGKPTQNFVKEKDSSTSSSSDDDDNYSNHFVKQNDNARGKAKEVYQEQFYENASNEDSDQEVGQRNTEYTEQNFTHRLSHATKSTKRKYSNLSEDNSSDQEGCKKYKFSTPEDEAASFKSKHSYEAAESTKQQTGTVQSSSAFEKNDKAFRMMKKMGYHEGEGLGKNRQGRIDPVEAATQYGRRGFGLRIRGLEDACLKWNAADEKISVVEDIKWLSNDHRDVPNGETLKSWVKLSPKKETIDDETTFCSPYIVEDVLDSKTVFNNVNKIEQRRARTRSNPYETIRGAFFLNRAAVKMANMDRVCDFMFTSPEDLQKDELLYFADVCAGPGGFSEYVLWRKKWHAKGFGFTLKNANDFKLDDFYAGPCETFHPFYGPKEDGNVFDPINQQAFRQMIMKHTHGKGVHFMMADGGFSIEDNRNIQEILSKQLYLCQCLVALMIVRNGGHFVTKLFDLFTPFSAGLVYLMYRCFEKVCIFKPNTSRPANSERYLICKKKRCDTDEIMEYLDHLNHLLLKNDPNNDVREMVSLDEMENERIFVQYLRESNDVLGRKQITGLLKIAYYCQNPSLIERQQATMREECLKYWNIPDDSRTIPRSLKPQELLRTLLSDSTKLFTSEPHVLTNENIKTTILYAPYDWYCMPCGSGESIDDNKLATFYLSMGRRKVYRYTRGSWTQVSDITLELPPNTLIYAELIYEFSKEKKYQYKTYALHILDAHTLGGEDVSKKYLLTRHELTKKFCEALWKPEASDVIRVRTKDLFPLTPKIGHELQLRQRFMKNNYPAMTYEFKKTPLDDVNDGSSDDSAVYPLYFVPNSVLFLRSTAQPWSRYYSKRHFYTYVFNCKTRRTLFDKDRPAEAEASFAKAFETRVVWYWPNDKSLTMKTIVDRVKKCCPEAI